MWNKTKIFSKILLIFVMIQIVFAIGCVPEVNAASLSDILKGGKDFIQERQRSSK